jgi:hypothetical protein
LCKSLNECEKNESSYELSSFNWQQLPFIPGTCFFLAAMDRLFACLELRDALGRVAAPNHSRKALAGRTADSQNFPRLRMRVNIRVGICPERATGLSPGF